MAIDPQYLMLVNNLVDTFSKRFPTAMDTAAMDTATQRTAMDLLKEQNLNERYQEGLTHDIALADKRDAAAKKLEEIRQAGSLSRLTKTEKGLRTRQIRNITADLEKNELAHAYRMMEADTLLYGKVVGKIDEKTRKYERFSYTEKIKDKDAIKRAVQQYSQSLEGAKNITPLQKATATIAKKRALAENTPESMHTFGKSPQWAGVPFDILNAETGDVAPVPMAVRAAREGREFTKTEREAGQVYKTGERIGTQEYKTGERIGAQEYDMSKFNKTYNEDKRRWDLEFSEKQALNVAQLAHMNIQLQKGFLDLTEVTYRVAANLALSGIGLAQIPEGMRDSVKSIRASEVFKVGELQRQVELQQTKIALDSIQLPVPESFIDPYKKNIFYDESAAIANMNTYFKTVFDDNTTARILKIAQIDPTNPKVNMYRNQLLAIQERLSEASGEFTGFFDELTPSGKSASALRDRVNIMIAMIDASNKRLIGKVK